MLNLRLMMNNCCDQRDDKAAFHLEKSHDTVRICATIIIMHV